MFLSMTDKDNEPYRFLSLFAHAQCDPLHLKQIAHEASRFESDFPQWEDVADQAEAQGIAPLLYRHLKEAGVHPPQPLWRTLQGLYLCHRDTNEVRFRILGEVLKFFDHEGIPAYVLKGGALAHLVYPEPGLRPMGDLDILVPRHQVRQAHDLLVKNGFTVPSRCSSPDEALLHGHLPGIGLSVDGIFVKVEIHHNLYKAYESHSVEVKDLTASPFTFLLGASGITAQTLGHEDMLRHLCLHLCNFYHGTSLLGMLRLIWVADVISFAERFAGAIDWERLKKESPFVLSTLSLLHFLTPLSEGLLHQASLQTEPHPRGVGKGYRGWPTSVFPRRGVKNVGRFLADTFSPSEWWLRLYYGLGTNQPLLWCRLVRHPLHVFGDIRNRHLIGRG